ncbi:Ubiquinone biosynthesis O-methyltransferase, mitochondrial [subsurface metagenome]
MKKSSSESRYVAKRYYASIGSGEGVRKLDERKRKILSLVPANVTRVLDVGCGNGLTLDNINAKEKYGIDINPKNVIICRRKGIHAIEQSAEEKFPFKNNYFDVIISEELIEHLFFPENFLKEIKRVLKPNGAFVGSMPNHFNWWHRLCFLFARPEKSPLFRNAAHISDNFWTLNQLRRMLSKHFKVEICMGIVGRLARVRPPPPCLLVVLYGNA